MPETLVELKNLDVALAGRGVLHDLNWRLEAGQGWALLGGNGAGKTTFLRLVRGEVWPLAGRGSRLYFPDRAPQESPLGFKETTRLVTSELLDRYARTGWDPRVEEAVWTGFGDTPYLYRPPTAGQAARAAAVLERLDLGHLARRRLSTLSRGQTRRALLARALAPAPAVLMLDECCEDLDPDSQAAVLEAVSQALRDGTTVLYATHRPAELVPGLTHALILDQGRITAQGPREAVCPAGAPAAACLPAAPAAPVAPAAEPGGDFLIAVRRADVFVEHTPVLEGLDWTLRPGEHWAVLGANGAGKTTFLRLLAGELHPAWGGEVAWFGDGRLWHQEELRARVATVAAHWQTRHRHPQTGLETVCSGLTGSMGLRSEPGPEDLARGREWLARLGMAELAQRDIGQMSYGQVRRLLIARALVAEPSVLLLDEPLAGLDPRAREEVGQLLAAAAAAGTSLVMVTHHAEDLLPCFTHLARLEGGRLSAQGPLGPS